VADADKQAITKLHHDGLTARDIGNLLGVSHQRVHQILKAA
jgi:DNA-directed RNA polymerase specialized sigma subunit